MEDLNCPSCGEEYNTRAKLPRLFPNCGHTFCSACIQKMIDQTEEYLSCPEDNVECQFFNKEVGIGCFPLNFALNRLLVQNNTKRGTMTLDRLERKLKEEQIHNLNYCNDHSKICELICLTDRKVICTDCVLFGIHKNHQYLRMDDFNKEVKVKLSTIDNRMDSIKFKGFLSDDKQIDSLRGKIEQKKNQLSKMVNDNIHNLIDEIKMKQREMEDSLESRFSKFDYALALIGKTASKLKDTQQSVERTINKIKSQLKTREFDYGFLMSSLYSENNIFVLIKELFEDLAQLEVNSVEIVDKELDKYTVEGDLEAIVKQVHDCMEIRYTEEEEEERSPAKKAKNNFDEETDKKTHILTPTKNKKSINVQVREEKRYIPSIRGREAKSKLINLNNDESINISRSNFDVSKRTINLNKEESISLIDVHIDEADSELFDDRIHDTGSINDRSISNNDNTSLVSKVQGLKKSPVFFQKSAKNHVKGNMNSNFIPDPRDERREEYSKLSNVVFTSEGYQRNGISKPVSQMTLPADSVFDTRSRAIASQISDKQHSWNDQEVNIYNSRVPNPQQRRLTIVNRVAPLSNRQMAIESETEIDLSRMNINDHTIPQLLSELSKNRKVKAVNLSHNSITEIGLEQMLKKLHTHPTLERIYMMNNYLDDSVFIKLEQWAKKLKKINYFNFKDSSHFKNVAKIKKYISSLMKLGIKVEI